MNKKSLIIEFFGLPGSGKSTVVNFLYDLLQKNNISTIKFSEIFDKYQSNLMRKIYLTFISILLQPKLFFICWKYKNFDFKVLNQIVYILRLFYFEETNYFKKSVKNYELIISDQYLIQAIASLMIPANNVNIDEKIISYFLTYTLNKIDILVYSKCDIETSFERLRKRNNQRTRFDFWDDKKCLINLERMYNIFEYVNNYFFETIISIDAHDEIENKVRLIYKKIYG